LRFTVPIFASPQRCTGNCDYCDICPTCDSMPSYGVGLSGHPRNARPAGRATPPQRNPQAWGRLLTYGVASEKLFTLPARSAAVPSSVVSPLFHPGAFTLSRCQDVACYLGPGGKVLGTTTGSAGGLLQFQSRPSGLGFTLRLDGARAGELLRLHRQGKSLFADAEFEALDSDLRGDEWHIHHAKLTAVRIVTGGPTLFGSLVQVR
jgi:hypothetical protein